MRRRARRSASCCMPRPWTSPPSVRAAASPCPACPRPSASRSRHLKRVAGDKVAARIKREPDPFIMGIVDGWPRNFEAKRARQLGFTTAEKTFDDIIKIHIEDELGGKFASRVLEGSGSAQQTMTRVACIGECMIELKQARGGGLYSRGFGGDTLNTAVYLARLGVAVDYITALGDDPLSDEMVAGWRPEGVGTAKVARLAGKLPGIYLIATDDQGRAPLLPLARDRGRPKPAGSARDRKSAAIARRLRSRLSLGDHALDLYAKAGGGGCWRRCAERAQRGTRIAFDTNFRIRGWPDLDIARASSARRSRHRISCSPRPRICCRSTRARPRKVCSQKSRAARSC